MLVSYLTNTLCLKKRITPFLGQLPHMVGSLERLSAGKAVLAALISQPRGFSHHSLARNILSFFFLAQNSMLSKYVAILWNEKKKHYFPLLQFSLQVFKEGKIKSHCTSIFS